jgi:3-demethoxyubiquinol 3-hydroxylase
LIDSLIRQFDRALRTASGVAVTVAALPASTLPGMPAPAREHAAALMRVNHVGEVCAQALYHGQALTAHTPQTRAHMERAAAEEGEHLALCAARIGELGGRVSWLNPVWYAGAFALGAAAGRAGDATSLGFVAETERQVEAHLEGHLSSLPAEDVRSRAIVARMRDDEARHRQDATAAGAAALPFPVRLAMKAMAKVMTTVAYRV